MFNNKKYLEDELDKDRNNGPISQSLVLDSSKNNNNAKNDSINLPKESKVSERCWICLNSESTKKNPKLLLCSCKNYIHFLCLKNYIKSKIEISERSNLVKTYECYQFNYEVCLKPYPLRFEIKEFNKTYELIDYNIAPEFDYLVLESLDFIQERNNLKIIHVVKLTKNEIKIRRSLENDIIDSDMSVSRKHAVLKYNKIKGIITIENRSEKNRTSVLIKGNITMKKRKISFQVGNNYVTAYIIDKTIDENNECNLINI